VNDEGLADLGVLVGGFLQLIRSSAEQRAAPQPATPAASMAAGPSAAPRSGRASAGVFGCFSSGLIDRAGRPRAQGASTPWTTKACLRRS